MYFEKLPVGMAAFDLWKLQGFSDVATNITVLTQYLSLHASVSIAHVYSHDDHPWNQLADRFMCAGGYLRNAVHGS
eukprot:10579809-Karenia_brevis.AAC.1